VAVVGAGPAGIACAVGLARLGHDVVLHDAQPKGGGLNEYGLASYKVAGQFAQRELDWLLGIGGITLKTGWKLQTAAQLRGLRDGLRRRVPGRGPGRHPGAAACRAKTWPACAMRSTSSPNCARRPTCPPCPSAAAWW
jgi:NADPH-dependent 2,4-dienoyl-CoA reductase/sulfur reductase-like enzyme